MSLLNRFPGIVFLTEPGNSAALKRGSLVLPHIPTPYTNQTTRAAAAGRSMAVLPAGDGDVWRCPSGRMGHMAALPSGDKGLSWRSHRERAALPVGEGVIFTSGGDHNRWPGVALWWLLYYLQETPWVPCQMHSPWRP